MYTRSPFLSLVFASLTLAFSSVAHSEPGKLYLFAAIGDADSDFRASPVDVVADDDSTLAIGAGFTANRYLAFELAYHDFGDPIGFAGCPPEVLCIQAFLPEPVEIDGWSAALVGSVPVSDAVDVYAKLGVLAWDASARSDGLNDSGQDLLLGAGLTWRLGPRWALQFGYERVELDISATRLAAAYRF